MKRFTVTLLGIALLLGAVTPVFAQDNTSATRANYKAEMDARKAELEATRKSQQAEIEAKRSSLRAELDAQRQQLNAAHASTTAVRRELRASTTEAIKEMKDDNKAEREAFKASSTAKRVEMQQSVAKRKVENTTKVITATIDRLLKITTRIEERVARVKATGKSTAEAEAFIVSARTELEAAKAGVASFASLDLSADKMQANMETIRTAVQAVKEHIGTAREDLMKANRSLGDDKTEVHATSTINHE